jgi:metallo-beta-lactamase family protein
MSAHGDTDELLRFLSCQEAEKVKKVFLVHGEEEVQKAFASRLELKGFKQVYVPGYHEGVELDKGSSDIKTKAA